MTRPEGTLTGPQFEILELTWQNPAGMTVAEIWEVVRENRSVSRTTILNLVDRLEKRNWLQRLKVEGVYRYQASVSREQTQEMLAGEFVGTYFSGSATDFILSFLGSQRLSKKELDRMKKALEDKKTSRKSSKGSRRRKDNRQ